MKYKDLSRVPYAFLKEKLTEMAAVVQYAPTAPPSPYFIKSSFCTCRLAFRTCTELCHGDEEEEKFVVRALS